MHLFVFIPLLTETAECHAPSASMYLYKAISIPLIIYLDQRDEYFNALKQADLNIPKKFVDFVFTRAFEGMRIQKDRLTGRPNISLSEPLNTMRNALGPPDYRTLALELLNYITSELAKIKKDIMSTVPLHVEITSRHRKSQRSIEQ